jgi:hypothetical protein
MNGHLFISQFEWNPLWEGFVMETHIREQTFSQTQIIWTLVETFIMIQSIRAKQISQIKQEVEYKLRLWPSETN